MINRLAPGGRRRKEVAGRGYLLLLPLATLNSARNSHAATSFASVSNFKLRLKNSKPTSGSVCCKFRAFSLPTFRNIFLLKHSHLTREPPPRAKWPPGRLWALAKVATTFATCSAHLMSPLPHSQLTGWIGLEGWLGARPWSLNEACPSPSPDRTGWVELNHIELRCDRNQRRSVTVERHSAYRRRRKLFARSLARAKVKQSQGPN